MREYESTFYQTVVSHGIVLTQFTGMLRPACTTVSERDFWGLWAFTDAGLEFFANSFEPGTKCARYDTTEVHCSVCVHFRSLFVFFSEGDDRSHYFNVRKVWF